DEGFEGLECKDHGLTRLPAAEKHGLVWVTGTPGPEIDVDALLGGLAPEMAAYGIASHIPFKTARLEKQMNWKLAIDTFLETWHVATLHVATVAPIFQPNVNAFDAFGRNGRLIIPRRTIVEMRGGKGPENGFLKHTAIVYQMFPNAALVWQADHFELWRAFPAGDDPARCITEATLYTPEPATSDKAKAYWEKNFDLLMRTVEAEDFPVCEGIQRGLLSGAQEHITFGRNEPALGHYHASLAAALGAQHG
ncbi:MAG TPA: SRPBCC family protein, partial [Hyphomicrobiaceae bacterium]|nr:SRPBCC family protein [Hyphomicrobiaceae bacterium]